MGIALISFSNNYDMQEHMYSLQMFNRNYITIGSNNILLKDFERSENNYFFSVPKRPTIENKTFNFVELFKVVDVIKKREISSIIFLSSHTWNYFLTILLSKKIKIYHIMHEIVAHSGEKVTRLTNFYIKMIFNRKDYYIVHSKAYIDLAVSIYKIDREKIYYLPLWMPRYEYKEHKNSGICLFFGRINKYKGIENIITLAELNQNIYFYIVGRVSGEIAQTIKVLKEMNNIKIVDSYVNEEELHEYFYNAEIVILPYIEASQSGVIIDAYIHSRPVIAFDVGNLKEQVLDNETGFLIEARNCKMMSDKLKKYFALDINKKNQYCYNAWKYSSNFSVEQVDERLKQIVREDLLNK